MLHLGASKVKAHVNPAIKAHLLRGGFYVVLLLAGTLLAFLRPEAPAKVSQRTLTFAQRVVYQRAIEEIYWRHRIWPKERPDPKPSLDAVMSQAKVEEKVAEYLNKSQALDDYWQQPITAQQLQAEMDRMAQHTKQPEVLRELFEALGNDPFVVAECLARPVLSERLTADFSVQDKTGGFKSARVEGLRSVLITTTAGHAAYNLPTIPEGGLPCTNYTWTATSTNNAPLPRYYHTAVWTGTEMIVWGGLQFYYTVNDGGRYNPATDSWTATSTTNAPSARCLHTAVWTGSEMILWGGGSVVFGGYLNTGGRYDPTTDSWTATSTTNAPLARYFHTAVWTGGEMIVWGGYNTNQLNTGARYNPDMDSWTATSTTNASARQEHTAVWTGSEMIVWGGYLFDGSSHFLNTGGRYNPTTNSWTGTSTTNAPIGRRYHTSVWTGNEVIVWGGEDADFVPLNTGGRYNPGMDNWIATSTNDAPTPRYSHTAIWTDCEMVVWSGYDGFSYLSTDERYRTQTSLPTPAGTTTPTPTPTPIPTPPIPGTGARYDPSTDTWRATSTTNAASQRQLHSAVWTGSEMIVWGGADLNGFLNTGGRYSPRVTLRSRPTPRPRPTRP